MNKTSLLKEFIPYGKQDITNEDIENVVKVLNSEFITQGPIVNKFEEAISSKVNSKFAISSNSATSSLHLGCLALGLKKGDYLWTSPITFVASANCARYCGANVDFVDIDPKTGLMDIGYLEQKLIYAKKLGKLPKILIPVHLAGSSCDMRSIAKLSKEYGFSIIEDASHAIGGKYYGKPVGNCSYSSLVVFSFHPVKIITTGEGGIAVTNNKKLAQKMYELRSHGIVKDHEKFIYNKNEPWMYEQQELGFNYRMTDIHAALGLSQLKRLDEIVEIRNKIFSKYQELLSDLPVSLLEIPKGVISSLHLAVIRLKDKDPKVHKELFLRLRESKIGVQLHYNPVHLNPYYKDLGFKEGDFPEAEFYSQNAISLPIYSSLSIEKQEIVVDCIKKFFYE